jgi:hypothetical protein
MAKEQRLVKYRQQVVADAIEQAIRAALAAVLVPDNAPELSHS